MQVCHLLRRHNLEDDGPLALTCYEMISGLNAAARQAYYTNLTAIAFQIASGDSHMEVDLFSMPSHGCSLTSHTTYFQQLAGSMKVPLATFKAA